MSIKAEYRDGVFAPLQEMEQPTPAKSTGFSPRVSCDG